MLHSQIENEETVERYVRNQLSPREREAFEERFWACEECFEKLQTTERFVAGIRDGAHRGLLPDESRAASARKPGALLRWAFVATASTAVVFASVIGWTYLFQM